MSRVLICVGCRAPTLCPRQNLCALSAEANSWYIFKYAVGHSRESGEPSIPSMWLFLIMRAQASIHFNRNAHCRPFPLSPPTSHLPLLASILYLPSMCPYFLSFLTSSFLPVLAPLPSSPPHPTPSSVSPYFSHRISFQYPPPPFTLYSFCLPQSI